MRVLLTGASGFIGSHVAQALASAGHHVQAATRAVGVDFVHDTTVAAWLPRLSGVDAVVNAVGILRDSAAQPMQAIHTNTPIALFDACAQAGVRRVIQLSALGVDSGTTAYARTKRAADTHLLQLTEQGHLQGAVLRPSVVFGKGGASTALFANLAQLPALLLPQPVLQARIQPVAVQELAHVVVRLLSTADTGLFELAGSQALSMAELVARIRSARGQRQALILPMPAWLTQLSARVGDAIPASPWCTQSLQLLAQDNVADPATLSTLLGRSPARLQDMISLLMQA